MTLKAWFWCATTSLALVAPSRVQAATVLQNTVTVTIRSDSSVREHHELRVRMDCLTDVEEWSTYPVHLNENRSLVGRVLASAVLPDGKIVKVGHKDTDVVEASGAGSLADSGYRHELSFRGLVVGSEVRIAYDVRVEPYFPAGQIFLTGDDEIERLEVTLTGGGKGFRWRIDGPTEGLDVHGTEGGVRIEARDLPADDPPAWTPARAAWPVLRYAWDPDGTWEGVGRWYTELIGSLPRGTDTVRAQARELVTGLDDPRQRLEALLAFLRRKVRYEAVEIGVGSFRPSPPEDVLARRWGDCKDKALLLIDLLDEAGIAAYPVLIGAGRYRRLDREFPSPWQFNHAIVAVPAGAVALFDDDPVGDGYLFLDPTQERGSGRWLQPSDQDQDVLVVHGGGATLAHTPIHERQEVSRLVVSLHVTPEGKAVGGAGLVLRGRQATYFLEQIKNAPPERTEEDARAIFARLLPGVTLGSPGWTVEDGDVPMVDMSAGATVEGFVQGLGSRPSFQLAGLGAAPEPREIAGREVALVLRPRSVETTWNVVLPQGWCRPRPGEIRVENDVGLFSQSIRHSESGNGVKIERKVELRRRWVEPESLPALHELALAERRAAKRRIRLVCEEAVSSFLLSRAWPSAR